MEESVKPGRAKRVTKKSAATVAAGILGVLVDVAVLDQAVAATIGVVLQGLFGLF